MRFVLRSAFWLSVAFAVISPGLDADGLVQTFEEQPHLASRLVAENAARCTSFECLGTHAVLQAGIAAAGQAIQPQGPIVPFPRPRPTLL